LEGRVPGDLVDYRAVTGLPPHTALVVVSRSPDLPAEGLLGGSGRRVIVATTYDAHAGRVAALLDLGVEVVRTGRAAGDGRRLVEAPWPECLRLVCSSAGPEVLYPLLRAGVPQRLYLTTVLRVLAGRDLSPLVRGPRFAPPVDFRLAALYPDAEGPEGVQPPLEVYEPREGGPEQVPARASPPREGTGGYLWTGQRSCHDPAGTENPCARSDQDGAARRGRPGPGLLWMRPAPTPWCGQGRRRRGAGLRTGAQSWPKE
jgi:hypothetical protein